MATSYLQQLGGRWYVRVKVPRRIQGRVGNTHVRVALRTGQLEEANRLKWPVIARIQKELDRVRHYHDALLLGGDPVLPSMPGPPVRSMPAEEVALPARLTRSMVAELETLDALVERWLADADYLAQTKQQHKQAYSELRAYLGRDSEPGVVTPQLALDFVEEHLKRSGLSYATKRRKLNSLMAFWEWMGLRRVVARNANPWRGFRLGTKKTAGTPSRIKRAHTDEELLKVLGKRPSYKGLADVIVIGLLTGMRLDEICALRMSDIRPDDEGGYWLNIRKAKTRAGVRSVIVAHEVGVEVIKRRWLPDSDGELQFFPEFRGGGYDDKLSWAVSKAFARHRALSGLGGETDFHSFRRTFITLMENAGVDQVKIARFVGHELPTLAFAVYSGGSTAKTTREVANQVRYSPAVEARLRAFV